MQLTKCTAPRGRRHAVDQIDEKERRKQKKAEASKQADDAKQRKEKEKLQLQQLQKEKVAKKKEKKKFDESKQRREFKSMRKGVKYLDLKLGKGPVVQHRKKIRQRQLVVFALQQDQR